VCCKCAECCKAHPHTAFYLEFSTVEMCTYSHLNSTINLTCTQHTCIQHTYTQQRVSTLALWQFVRVQYADPLPSAMSQHTCRCAAIKCASVRWSSVQMCCCQVLCMYSSVLCGVCRSAAVTKCVIFFCSSISSRLKDASGLNTTLQDCVPRDHC
jgi:hypothetical protein